MEINESKYQHYKASVYKWRQNNLDTYRNQQRKYQADNYDKYGYTDAIKERKRKYNLFRAETKRRLQMLCNLFE